MNDYSYSQLLDKGEEHSISESSSPYLFLSERHLQAIWFEQKYFKGLMTAEGQAIRVVSPGIWNAEAGPDFKKAYIMIGNKAYFGDVEIHLSDEGWTQHGHHLDARYNDVVLHLSLWLPRQQREICTKEGTSIPRTYLESCLTIPKGRLLQLIDLDLYPYKQFLGSGKCAHSLFKKMPEDRAETLFTKAASWRLTQKRQALQQRCTDPRLAMPVGMAMALGYKHNSEAFASLYQILYPHRHLSEGDLLALGLVVCGFFSSAFQMKWKESSFYQTLLQRHHTLEIVESRIPLDLAQVRPFNHPVRRIAYLVKLVQDNSISRLYQKMESHWSASWPLVKTKKEKRELRMELCALLPSYGDLYWNCHYTFEKEPQKMELPMIGTALKEEILINTFFPLLQEAVLSNANDAETQAFNELCASLPAHPSRKAKYLSHRFFGETEKAALLGKNSAIQQGAYQLHRDFCVHYEASCEGCPFVDRYTQVN